jgi:hypothetical protein
MNMINLFIRGIRALWWGAQPEHPLVRYTERMRRELFQLTEENAKLKTELDATQRILHMMTDTTIRQETEKIWKP